MTGWVKKSLSLLLLGSLVWTAAACSSSKGNGEPSASGGAASPSGEASQSADAGKDPVTLSILLNQTWNKPNLEPMLREYEKQSGNVKIDLQIIPDEQFSQLLKTKVVTKEVPDLVYYNYGSLAQYFKLADTFVSLDDQPWVGNLANKDSVVSADGRIYGMPTNAIGSPFGIIYNKKLFADNGLAIPKTYEEFVALCEKIKGLGVDPLVMTAKDAWTVGMWDVTLFPNVVKASGNVTWDQLNQGQVKFSDVPGFEKALGMLKELADKKLYNPNFMSTTYDMGQTIMLESKAAMILQGDWFISDMYAKNKELQFGMFPFPVVDNADLASGHIQTFSVFKDSKHPEESRKLLEYLAAADQQAKIAQDWNQIPAFKGVSAELPYWLKEIQTTYIDQGKPPIREMGIESAIEIDELTTLSQDMLAGGVDAKTVLQEWDKKFAQLAKERKLPGW